MPTSTDGAGSSFRASPLQVEKLFKRKPAILPGGELNMHTDDQVLCQPLIAGLTKIEQVLLKITCLLVDIVGREPDFGEVNGHKKTFRI